MVEIPEIVLYDQSQASGSSYLAVPWLLAADKRLELRKSGGGNGQQLIRSR
jgi:hypothetical protein